MRLSCIDFHVLVEPKYDVAATSSAQEDIVVELHADEGVTGIGETDVNPRNARACTLAPRTHSRLRSNERWQTQTITAPLFSFAGTDADQREPGECGCYALSPGFAVVTALYQGRLNSRCSPTPISRQ